MKSLFPIVVVSLAVAALHGAEAPSPATPPSPPSPPAPMQSYAPDVLPGRGLAQHDFLYAGEWDYRKTEQTMFLVRGGQVVWSYSIPIKAADGTLQEWGDATLLSNGNVVFSRKTGAGIVTPEKKLIWNYDAPKGFEVHVAQPIGLERVMIVQNGSPAKAMVINIKTGATEKELVLPTAKPASSHGQFRRARYTKSGTFLVAHMDSDKVVEYDVDGKVIWSVEVPSPWAVARLPNGNTLVSSNKAFIREYDIIGKLVWEYTQKDSPHIALFNFQGFQRLANGNTVIASWNAQGIKDPKSWPGSVQWVEVTSDKKIVWALRSWNEGADFGPATSIQILDERGTGESFDLIR